MSAVFSAADEQGQDRQIAQLRVPPHSIEGESSVLGGLLLDNNAWDKVNDILVDSDFYRYEHRQIFAAIGALVNASKPVTGGAGVPAFSQGIDKPGLSLYLDNRLAAQPIQ